MRWLLSVVLVCSAAALVAAAEFPANPEARARAALALARKPARAKAPTPRPHRHPKKRPAPAPAPEGVAPDYDLPAHFGKGWKWDPVRRDWWRPAPRGAAPAPVAVPVSLPAPAFRAVPVFTGFGGQGGAVCAT